MSDEPRWRMMTRDEMVRSLMDAYLEISDVLVHIAPDRSRRLGPAPPEVARDFLLVSLETYEALDRIIRDMHALLNEIDTAIE